MAKGKSRGMDMLHGSLWDKMLVFALPLAMTGVLQQLYNAADVATLGRFVSSDAMGAVGNNVPVIGLVVALFMGLSLGANVIVARYIGIGDAGRANGAVHTAFTVAGIAGVVIALLGECLAGAAVSWMGVPAAVASHSETYLRVYLLGMPFIALYNFEAALFRSKGDTKTPMLALLAASVFNVAGNLFVVLVLHMGAGGVAATTAMANFVSAAILFAGMRRAEGVLHLEPRLLGRIDKSALMAIVRIGLPAAVQSMVFSISNLVIQSAINSLGPDAMAGSVAGFTVEINVYCFINAFGLAATTFVSQNYGAGNLARCRRATWVSMWINFAVTAALIAVVLFFGREILGAFSSSPAVIALGYSRILWVVTPEPLSVIMETVSDAMRGYGYSTPPAVVTLVSICGVRLIWVWTVFAAKPTFDILMAVYPVSWLVATVGLVWLYWRHQKRLQPL